MFTNDFSCVHHIICDGTFLRRTKGIYAIMDAQTKEIIYAAFNVSEGARDLMPLYMHLATLGLSPRSATVDGNPQQIRYLQKAWPHLAIQRCIVHVHRQGLSWCRRHPVRTDAKHLRKIFLALPKVKTSHERNLFLARVDKWEQRFGQNFKSPRTHGWVANDLKAARGMLLRSLPSLFVYLNDPLIPHTTNLLESYFGRMKHTYRNHRGLSQTNRDAYFRWYFYLKPR
jgi:transposase-like protein